MKRSNRFIAVFVSIFMVLSLFNNSVIAFGNDENKKNGTGYKITVGYNEDGKAQLVGSSEEVSSDIKLLVLKDEEGVSFNPYEFSKIVTESGVYSFDLEYEKEVEDGLTPKGETEKIQVEVNLQQDVKTESTEELEEQPQEKRSTIEVSELLEQKNAETILIGKAYADESKYSLGKNIQFKGGKFSDYTKELDDALKGQGINGRTFKSASIVYSGSNTEYAISSLYKYEFEDGTVKEFYVPVSESEKNSGGVTIAYEKKAGDEIRFYYGVSSTKLYSVNKNIPNENGWEITVEPNNNGQIQAGSKVIVRYKVPSKYSDVKIKVKYQDNSKEVKIEEIEKLNLVTYTGVFAFEMPESNVVFQYEKVEKAKTRNVGILTGDSDYYQPCEVGYQGISLKYGNTTIKHFVERKLDPNSVGWDYNHNDFTGYKTEGTNIITGIGDYNSTKSQNVKFPVTKYNSGSSVTIEYSSHRTKFGLWDPSLDPWTAYEYEPTRYFIIDYYSGDNSIGTENFSRYNFRTYQSKEEYYAAMNSGESVPPLSNAVDNKAQDSGYYPVKTVLPNGVEIISTPIVYNRSESYKHNKNKMDGIYFTYKIEVRNAWDDFKIIAKSDSTANGWNTMGAMQGLEKVDVKLKENNVLQWKENISQGFTFTTAQGTNNQFEYKLKVKKGYSAPKITFEDNFGNDIKFDLGTKKDNSFWLTNSSFYDSNEKVFKLTYQGSHGHGAYLIDFTSKPIDFSYEFKNAGVSDTGYSVEGKRYFSVPVTIPSIASGHYFLGWQLKVEMANGKSIVIPNNRVGDYKSEYFLPGDLVDISYVYDKLAENFSNADMGKESYKLVFESMATTVSSSSPFIKAKYTVEKQATFNGDYDIEKSKTVQVIQGENVAVGNFNRIETFEEQKYVISSNSILGRRVNKSGEIFAQLLYDKVIKVEYNSNEGNLSNVKLPIDEEEYTTVSNNNNTVITVKGLTESIENQKLVGWKIQGDDSGKIYKVGEKLDLSNVDENLGEAIVSCGKVVFVAQWEITTPVKVVSSSNETKYLATGTDFINTKEFLISNLSEKNLSEKIIFQKFDFDVYLKNNGSENNSQDKVKERYIEVLGKDIDSALSGNGISQSNWFTEGNLLKADKKRNPEALTFYFWGDSIKIYTRKWSNAGKMTISIDGVEQETIDMNTNRTGGSSGNSFVYDSGYLGYKNYSNDNSKLHKIVITPVLGNAENVFIDKIQFVTDHYTGNDISDKNVSNPYVSDEYSNSGRVFYDYEVKEKDSTLIDGMQQVQVLVKTLNVPKSIHNKEIGITAWNKANTQGNLAVSSDVLVQVYNKIKPYTGSDGESTELDTVKNQLIYGPQKETDTGKEIFTFEAKFKYDTDVDWENQKSTFNYRWMKNNPPEQDSSGWKSWSFNNKVVSVHDGKIRLEEEIDSVNGVIILKLIKINGASAKWENNSLYRVYAWNDGNNAKWVNNENKIETNVSINNGTTPSNENEVGADIPSVTFKPTVMETYDVVKYPSRIAMFDKNGDIESNEQHIVLVTKDSNGNKFDVLPNYTYEVGVNNTEISMMANQKQMFTASVYKNGSLVTDNSLGTLDYSNDLNNDTGIKFYLKKTQSENKSIVSVADFNEVKGNLDFTFKRVANSTIAKKGSEV